MLRFGYNIRVLLLSGGKTRLFRRVVGEHLPALALYGALAVFFTYPLIFNLDRVNGAGDPAVMVWSVAWIQHSMFSGATLYDANIFHPTANALAYTDLLLPSAIATAPLYYATNNPLISFNVVLLLTYVFSGYAAFLLARRLLAGKGYALPAALFAGAVYALCPCRSAHITQLNSMSTYFLPLILLFTHRYLEDGRRLRDLSLACLFFFLNAISGLYYGVFAALMVAAFLGIWLYLNRERPSIKDLLRGAPILAGSGVVLILLLWPYLVLSGAGEHERGIETVAGGSFVPAAIPTSPPESRLFGWTPETFGMIERPVYEMSLYPGFAVAALTVYGLGARRRLPRLSALYAILGLVILVLSFGPLLIVGDLSIPLPYYLLYEFVPGFGNLRVPARMWAVVMLCIAMLAAFGLRALMERLRGKRAVLTLAAISLLTALEFLPTLPLDRFIDRGPPRLEPAYEYLSENTGPETIVAEVPFANPEDPFRETPRMYRSTFGWWRLVNGYAGYFPEGYTQTAETLNSLPSRKSITKLRRLGADYVIVHPELYEMDGKDSDAILRALENEPSLERVIEGDGVFLYRVGQPDQPDG